MHVFPEGYIFFTVVDLVGCQIISLLGTNFKINYNAFPSSFSIYEVLIAELHTLCLDKLPFFHVISYSKQV